MKTYEIGAVVILITLLMGACTFQIPDLHGYQFYPILLLGLMALIRA
jgi:hypothetical protein